MKRGQILSRNKIDGIMSVYRDQPGGLLSILEQVQNTNKFKYLPLETLRYIAKGLKIPQARVSQVVTFYSFFNLAPQGEHTITICRGTACHTRGSKRLLLYASSLLGFSEDDIESGKPLTTPDLYFTLRTVACLGQCALAPVVDLDNTIYSYVTEEGLKKIIETVRTGQK
jgi:NADH:ubiquinone oxidoreductase subunit E